MNSSPSLPSLRSHCAIIGGGPAGLMAAERLASKGITVTLYERMPNVGRKFLMAGRGGLNLTHSDPREVFAKRYGEASSWLKPALDAFTSQDLRNWCESLGQKTFVGTSGRVFPESLKASPLLRAWIKRLDALGVKFVLRHQWQGWNEKGQLQFLNSEGQKIVAPYEVTILALGGASWPRLGSDGTWVKILRAENISVHSLEPANSGFIAPWSEIFRERFAGSPLKPIKLTFKGKSFQGEAMVTKEGLEGSAIYALSSHLRETIKSEGKAELKIDLRPGLSRDEILKRLETSPSSQSTTNYLRKVLGLSPVAIGIMRENVKEAILPSSSEALLKLIKDATIILTSTTSLSRAISTAGGIAQDELDPHFMLKKKPGVFAIGEMLNWEAPTGGYLLQACFSQAVVAAEGVESHLRNHQALSDT